MVEELSRLTTNRRCWKLCCVTTTRSTTSTHWPLSAYWILL